MCSTSSSAGGDGKTEEASLGRGHTASCVFLSRAHVTENSTQPKVALACRRSGPGEQAPRGHWTCSCGVGIATNQSYVMEVVFGLF